ncbi:MAG: cation:proton antiporter [Eubacteriales bacterium]|nr:cation:proton antiporter [Eubacteriales bacterium]
MLDNIWFEAAIWMGLAFIASLISIRVGISVALIEMFVGILAGNFLGIHETTQWIDFLAMLGSGVLTFLAGAEIDPKSLKANIKISSTIGILSFALPFAFIWMFTQYVLGWGVREAQIAGIALSTTSVAVIYAVLIEKELANTSLGKTLLASCFITDLGTVLALGVLFADFNDTLLIFIVVLAFVLWLMPRWTKHLIVKLGTKRVSEPEVKFILLVLFFMGGLATTAKSEAVLPAYLIGLVVAGVFLTDKTLVNRMRTIAFTIFTPFYFIKAGLYVSLKEVYLSAGIIAVLLLLKIFFKTVGVWPAAYRFKMSRGMSTYTTLLMSTGLTFGTISALYGLNNHIIDQGQYTILVTVVILSAMIPTLIAQRFFEPTVKEMNDWNQVKEEKHSLKHFS